MVFLLELNMVSGLFIILFVILGVFELKLRRKKIVILILILKLWEKIIGKKVNV